VGDSASSVGVSRESLMGEVVIDIFATAREAPASELKSEVRVCAKKCKVRRYLKLTRDISKYLCFF